MAVRHAEQFVAEKRPWIERTLRQYRDAEASLPPVRLEDGGEIPYLGQTLPIRVNVEPWRTRPGVSRRGGKLHVSVIEPGEEAVRDALTRWYKRKARIEIAERLDWATLRAGSTYAKLQIRDPASRWASCSSTGALSFSWRLLLAPEPILAYVVEHEVAHLDVMDHSRRFWKLVEQRCPDYREHERWLRSYGPGLRSLICRFGHPRAAPDAALSAGRRRSGPVRAGSRSRRLALLLVGPLHRRRAGECVHRADGSPARGGRAPGVRDRGRGGQAAGHHRAVRVLGARPACGGGDLAWAAPLGQRRQRRFEGAGAGAGVSDVRPPARQRLRASGQHSLPACA